ncbi:HAD family hydrolase [Rhizobium halophilum]|uniref:HAD family hydrolase n=1 Tax=Rhizobium halophilum TaxID=2846852 RepID=UPI001EFCB9CA|nr:HAD family hydrolase [Rhizobium halophilum]MCF6367332.1 HAD family hydrolase [Rhizobium halophilum]
MTATDLLIFDCDGVLIDSEPLASRVLWQALRGAGADVSHQEVWQRFTGFAEADAKKICREAFDLRDTDQIFEGLRTALQEEFARALSPMPGMPDLVRSLSIRKCVASNSSFERLKNSLGLFDLWHEFSPYVFSGESVARPKPAPDLFLHCADAFGLDPARCLVIDDSPHGILGGVAAGMRTIGFVDPSDPRPDRYGVLKDAGAEAVVTGATGLKTALEGILSGGHADGHPAQKRAVPA